MAGSGRRTSQLVVRVEPGLRAQLDVVAKANERTLAQQVRYMLRVALAMQDEEDIGDA